MNEHEPIEQRISAHLDGESPVDERERIEAKLAHDPQLAGLRDDFEQLGRRLRDAADAIEPVDSRQLARWRGALGRRDDPIVLRTAQMAAAAAVVVLGVGAGMLLTTNQTTANDGINEALMLVLETEAEAETLTGELSLAHVEDFSSELRLAQWVTMELSQGQGDE